MARATTAFRDWLGRTFFREVTVVQARDVGPRFRRLSIRAKDVDDLTFEPGSKVQVMLSEAGPRTYTPFAFDRTRGTIDLLVHHHGDTPGAHWGKHVAVGDRAYVFGPRGSLPLGELSGPVVFFGDETSFAAARSLDERRGRVTSLACVFEASSIPESSCALDDLALRDRELVSRSGDGSHLARVDERLRAALSAQPSATLVMTGSAQSIQHLRAALRRAGAPIATQKVKAYWSLGKRGLD